jgi:hypothetical protein
MVLRSRSEERTLPLMRAKVIGAFCVGGLGSAIGSYELLGGRYLQTAWGAYSIGGYLILGLVLYAGLALGFAFSKAAGLLTFPVSVGQILTSLLLTLGSLLAASTISFVFSAIIYLTVFTSSYPSQSLHVHGGSTSSQILLFATVSLIGLMVAASLTLAARVVAERWDNKGFVALLLVGLIAVIPTMPLQRAITRGQTSHNFFTLISVLWIFGEPLYAGAVGLWLSSAELSKQR